MTFYERVKEEVDAYYTKEKRLYFCKLSYTFAAAWNNPDYRAMIFKDAETFLDENELEGVYADPSEDVLFYSYSTVGMNGVRFEFLDWAIENKLDLC